MTLPKEIRDRIYSYIPCPGGATSKRNYIPTLKDRRTYLEIDTVPCGLATWRSTECNFKLEYMDNRSRSNSPKLIKGMCNKPSYSCPSLDCVSPHECNDTLHQHWYYESVLCFVYTLARLCGAKLTCKKESSCWVYSKDDANCVTTMKDFLQWFWGACVLDLRKGKRDFMHDNNNIHVVSF